MSFTSGARAAHAAILPLDRGQVSRVGDAGSPAPYSCPCLTPGLLRPPRPTPSRNTSPSGHPHPARHPALLRADDRRCDHASALVGDASSRRLCSPRSGTEAAANPCPVCVPRLAGRGTRLTHAAGQGTLPVTVLGGALPVPCTRNPGYASLNARLRPVPVRHERPAVTPMVRVLVRRSPVNPVRSEEAAVSGQLRVPRGCLAGATTPATGGRGGTMRAHGHFLPVVTPPRPSRTWPPPASRQRATQPSPAPHDAPPGGPLHDRKTPDVPL